jgi:uncharacterized protein YabE (DUF348 family)
MKIFFVTQRLNILLLLLSSIILWSVVVWGSQVYAASTPTRERIITIHDRGVEKVVVTKATTVSDVLKEVNISVNPDDMVDPFLKTRFIEKSYHINIYRAQPIIIKDGVKRYNIMTSHSSARQIMNDAALAYYDEDIAKLTRPADILQSEGVSQELTITRATPFTLVLYGKAVEARTQEKTVGAMVEKKGITLGPNDALSLPAQTPITTGMKVEVWRNGKQTITEEQPVVFDTQKIRDAAQPVGYRQIKTPGVNGKKVVTFEVDMRNGQEIVRREIQSVQILAPQSQVEVIGTKPSFTGDFAAALAKLRSCEGGYNSWNPAGYYGAYQFDRQTWSTVADPSLYGNATPEQQDQAAYNLYLKRGWRPWPSCGASLPDVYR